MLEDFLALLVILACTLIPCGLFVFMMVGSSAAILGTAKWVTKKEEERLDNRYKRK